MISEAIVGERDLVTEQGAGTQYFVRCPDQYLVECGNNRDRAAAIAVAINAWLDSQNGNTVTKWPPSAMPF